MSKNKKCLFFLFSIFLSIILLILTPAKIVFASVDKIVFINEPQIINIGEYSKQYQIQLQDANNLITTSPDTTYFTLPLDIGTFSSKNTTDSEPFTASSSIYIATGSSNKYFYFKSNTAGEYILKISARNKDNTKQWQTEQVVKIVDGTLINSTSSDNINTISTSTTNNLTSTPTPSVVVRTIYVSSHTSTEDLSNYDEKTIFQISAGRERMALVGSPIKFNAKYSLAQSNSCVPSFTWTFGDGFLTVAQDTEHYFKHAGEYQVVLNSTCGSYNSVSRTIVKVVSPEISILSLAGGDVEIKNNGKTEINIGNWKIIPTSNVSTTTAVSENKIFTFPQDTIISSGKSIVLSKEDLIYSTAVDRLSLSNPSGREVTFALINNTEIQKPIAVSESALGQQTSLVNDKSITIIEAEKLVKDYKEKLALKDKQISDLNKQNETQSTQSVDNSSIIDKGITESASVLESVNSSSTKSFWAKLIDIPVKGVKSFVRMFYDF